MTEPTPNTATADKPTDKPADETFGWTADAGANQDPAQKSTSDTVSNLFGTLRDAFDDFAERATPTVREVGARTAEIAALAADKAGPVVKKVGDVAFDASGKLAVRSREWASDVRASMSTDTPAAPDVATAAKDATETVKDAASDVADAASDAVESAKD